MNAGQEIIEHQGNGSVGGEILAHGGAVQQVRSAYATAVAVQRPRILKEVARRVAEEAALAGEDFYYGWRAGQDSIEGPSVKMALCLARNWGNCAIELGPVQDLPDAWVFTAYFIDLETGFTLPRQFRQSKDWVVHGRLDEGRKEDMRFQIGQSKCIRNVILNAIPASLVTRAMAEAKKGVRTELEQLCKSNSFATVADRLVSALGKCGAKEHAVLAKCGITDRKGLTLDHLVILRGDLNALQNGQERVEVLFPAVEQPASPSPSPGEPDLNAHWKKPLEEMAETLPQERPAAPEAQPEPAPAKSLKKATKKTLMSLESWMAKCHLSPPAREEYCAQYHVQTLAELLEAQAQSIISELADAHTKRGPDQREPGDESEGE